MPLRRPHSARPSPPPAPRCPSCPRGPRVRGLSRPRSCPTRTPSLPSPSSRLYARPRPPFDKCSQAKVIDVGSTQFPVPWPAQTITVSGRRLTVRRAEPTDHAGHFQPALFIHGLGGSSLDWTGLMGLVLSEMLSEAIDLPGFGYSPPSSRRRDCTIAGYARLVADFIKFNDRGSVHLIGNSLGGAVATRVAALRPELVRTLTLISPALPDLRLTRTTAMIGAVGVPGFGARISRKLQTIAPERRLELLLNMIFANSHAGPPEWRDFPVDEIRRRSELPYSSTVLVRGTRAIISAYTDPRPDRLWRLAARVQAPTLLVYG